MISINLNVNTDYTYAGCRDDPSLHGPTSGTMNLSGYVGTTVYVGEPGRPGAQVLWIRKYDCEKDELYFIHAGEGRSFKSDDVNFGEISLNIPYSYQTRTLSASSQGGPQNFYTDSTQSEGRGMKYTGGPIAFDTKDLGGCTLEVNGVGTGYLQNFSVEFVPGAFPVANYSYMYNP
jgi:hypothetical protein